MTKNNQARRLLRSAMLSVTLLLSAAPAALANPADLGLNPADADYSAYLATLNRDLHQTTANDEVPDCAQCSADVRATLWNLDNVSAR